MIFRIVSPGEARMELPKISVLSVFFAYPFRDGWGLWGGWMPQEVILERISRVGRMVNS